MIQAQKIVEKVARELEDLASVRWTIRTIVGYLNDCILDLQTKRPDAFIVREQFACVAGAMQTLPAGGVKLISVPKNDAGKVVTPTDGALLDAFNANWRHGASKSAADHYIWDARTPNKFEVYPPVFAGTFLQVEYVKDVPEIAVPSTNNFASVTGNLQFDAAFLPAIVAYVLGRCYSQRNELSDPGKASMYMSQYAQLIGAEAQSTLAVANTKTSTEFEAQK